jgi:hypothetical protein
MRCQVHHVEGCYCQFARAPKQAVEVVDSQTVRPARPSTPPRLLALTFAGALIACSSAAPAPCTPRDVQLTAHEADCLLRVKDECAGIPADQPCPFEDACKAFTRERCK